MTNESLPPPIPDESASDRKAGWWSWPVIIVSVFFIGWSVNLFAPKVAEEMADEHGVIDASDLALFKIQSQVIIAAAPMSGPEAIQSLDELRTYVQNDAMVMALALLESFLELDGLNPSETLSAIAPDSSPETTELVKRAIESGLSEAERETLTERLGWFAELAPSAGGEAPPKAEAIRIRAMLFLGLASMLFVGVALGVVAGAVLLFLQRRQALNGRSGNRFSAVAVPRGIMLESFALYLAIMALGDLGGQWIHPWISYMSYLLAVVVPFLWPGWRGVAWKDFRRSIGWHRGEGLWREIGAGFVGYLKVMAIASIGIFLTLLLSTAVGAFASSGGTGEVGVGAAPVGPQTHPIVGWIYLGGWQERLLCFFLAAVFAPVFEELFFRGALHRWLRGRFPFLISALLTGAIFAALHPQGWLGIPALAAIGVGFSLLRESRDSLIAPMVAHSINNGVLVTTMCIAL